MGLKTFLSFIFFLFVILGLIFYWIIPFNTVEFGATTKSSNFSLGKNSINEMQFYPNMRYPDSRISYRIYDCTLQKENDMIRAFQQLSEKTILQFYSSNSDEQITVTCSSKNKILRGLFIAGEGGPSNITKSGEFNVILQGNILLIRESECPKPNVAIHELLHALGYDHSKNPKNIMYNISQCDQTIGDDTIESINNIYSIQGYPDLIIEDTNAIMNGKYLDLNVSIRNNGLKNSQKAILEIYADQKKNKGHRD